MLGDRDVDLPWCCDTCISHIWGQNGFLWYYGVRLAGEETVSQPEVSHRVFILPETVQTRGKWKVMPDPQCPIFLHGMAPGSGQMTCSTGEGLPYCWGALQKRPLPLCGPRDQKERREELGVERNWIRVEKSASAKAPDEEEGVAADPGKCLPWGLLLGILWMEVSEPETLTATSSRALQWTDYALSLVWGGQLSLTRPAKQSLVLTHGQDERLHRILAWIKTPQRHILKNKQRNI